MSDYTPTTDRTSLARTISLGIARTGPVYENVPVNSCPDDDPVGEPRPMKCVPVNDLSPFVDYILNSDWLAAHDAEVAAKALLDAASDWEALVIREKPPVRGYLWLRARAARLSSGGEG